MELIDIVNYSPDCTLNVLTHPMSQLVSEHPPGFPGFAEMLRDSAGVSATVGAAGAVSAAAHVLAGVSATATAFMGFSATFRA